jgi:hypothetical protein
MNPPGLNRKRPPSPSLNNPSNRENGTRQPSKRMKSTLPSEQSPLNSETETISKKPEESVNRTTAKIEDGPDGYKHNLPETPSIVINLASWVTISPRNRILLHF